MAPESRPWPEDFEALPVLSTLRESEPALADCARQPGKRAFESVLAAVVVALLSPLLAATALAVKLDDGGPILYRRRVVGRKGTFDGFKFRTMRVDADAWLKSQTQLQAEFEENFKLPEDPRVTRLGRWLRRSSLDELPQLFNVLRGEMALVGPRFICPPELEKYGEFARELRTVRPGMTGYWQIYGRQRVGYKERVEMDINYIRNWSWWLDLKILAATPLAVLRGRGAY